MCTYQSSTDIQVRLLIFRDCPKASSENLYYVSKFPRTRLGNTMILVCVDAFSKFVWLIPVREATTTATIKALKERVFSNFSVPEILVSDNAH
jgi:hypothetical protein